MRKFHLGLIIGLGGLLSAAALAEVVPTQMNFQGVLTNTSGNPIADSTKSVQFTIYDALSAGNVLWAETLNVSTDNQGRFTVILGQVVPLYGPVFSDTSRYLGVRVGNDPEISPRAKISSVAYSLRTGSLNGAFGGTLVGGNPGEGAALYLDNGSGLPGVGILGNIFGLGGDIALYEADGDQSVSIDPNAGGAGGNLIVWSDLSATSNRIQLDGNYFGTAQPNLGVYGTSRFAEFNMYNSGDVSVSLPADAISGPEMLDEPGVASSIPIGVNLSNLPENIATRTITVPNSGYVLVIGTTQAAVNHSNGINGNVDFGVSNVSATFPGNQNVSIFLTSGMPSGLYAYPVTVHGLFSVNPGSNTFYFVADANGDTWDVGQTQFTLIFFSTAYGTVSPTLATGSSIPDEQEPTRGALTQAEIEAEQAEAKAFADARQDRELAEMKAQLEELKKKLELDANFKRVQAPQK